MPPAVRMTVGRLIDLPHGRRDLEDPVVSPDDPLHRVLPDIGSELDRVGGHQVGQLAAQHVLETGIVVDPLGVEQLASGNTPLQEDRPQQAPARIHGGAETGRPPAYDDDIQLFAADHALSR